MYSANLFEPPLSPPCTVPTSLSVFLHLTIPYHPLFPPLSPYCTEPSSMSLLCHPTVQYNLCGLTLSLHCTGPTSMSLLCHPTIQYQPLRACFVTPLDSTKLCEPSLSLYFVNLYEPPQSSYYTVPTYMNLFRHHTVQYQSS